MAQVEPGLSDWVVRACPDGLWVWDDDGATIFANERMAEMLGIDHAEIVGYSAFEAMDEAGRGDLARHLDQLRTTGRSGTDLDCCFHRPDGTHVWALVSHAPLLDDRGVMRGWLHRASEYSLQHRRLVELERRERLFVEAQRIARIASWEWDLPTNTVVWSAEMFQIYGLDPEVFQPSSDNFFDRVHPDDTAHVRETLAAALDVDTAVDFDYRFLSDEAEVRWLRSRAIVGRDAAGRPVRLTGTSQDVTESKENEDALSFLSAMGSAANEADTLQDVLLAADAIIKPYAQWPVLVISVPKERGDVELAHIDIEWTPASDEMREVARNLAVRAAGEHRIVEVVGPTGTVLIAGVVEAAGRLGCVVVCDTQRATFGRTSDLAIFNQMITMLTSVAQREWAAEDLAAARDQALEASRVKSEFLATMSHEIRTPLNGVIGLSELLGSTELTPHQRRLASGVDQAGRTLLALINDILDLSKIEAGRLDLEAVDFDPRAVVEHSVALVVDQARAKELELIVSCAADLPEQVCGDPVRFGQVISNLAANAVKFTSTGEVSIRATGGHGPRGTGVRVEVSDTGIGVSHEVQTRLFQPFTQADSSTTRKYGGTGLGLAISKRIVAAMDGRIGVDSEPGVGSTFWFEVAFDEPHAQDHRRRDLTAVTVAGLRVLVVDDNETNRFVLTEKLSSWGVETTAVVSAYEALVALDTATRDQAPYDIVLLDYMMPGADGEQLARIIRAESRHDRTRLALLSSGVEPSEAFLAGAGIDTFLSKPVLPQQLLDTLARLSGRSGPSTGVASVPVERIAQSTDGGKGRILVVEDNPINQLVAEGVLHKIGYHVVVVEDGAAAVAAYAADVHGFDAILMDCQMPVMNGYDATRAIRAMELLGPRVPIIAMTAAALSEERERCLEAGMDDFLLKPVTRTLLSATLERWTSRREMRAGTAADPEARTSSELLPADTATTSSTTELDRTRLTGMIDDDAADLDLVLQIIDRFGARAGVATADMQVAISAGDPVAVVDLAHGLRGSAANVGLQRLAELLADIEVVAAGGELPTTAALDQVRTALAVGMRQLEGLASDLARHGADVHPSR
ncbi:MAG: sensor hybrid histidine kinase [Marmoricola sp.]|nr:sensor hybrid histidine kinase [Marmoricola sp.]